MSQALFEGAILFPRYTSFFKFLNVKEFVIKVGAWINNKPSDLSIRIPI